MEQNDNLPTKEESDSHSDEASSKRTEKVLDFIPDPEQKKEAYEILSSEITFTRVANIGPLPPAEQMVLYEKTLPGSADRIIKHSEIQRDHRIEMEKLDFPDKSRQYRRGQWFSFIIGLCGLGVATLLALMGHDWVAGIIGTVTVGTILATLHRHLSHN